LNLPPSSPTQGWQVPSTLFPPPLPGCFRYPPKEIIFSLLSAYCPFLVKPGDLPFNLEHSSFFFFLLVFVPFFLVPIFKKACAVLEPAPSPGERIRTIHGNEIFPFCLTASSLPPEKCFSRSSRPPLLRFRFPQ